MKYRLLSVALALACLLTLFVAVPRAQAHSRAQARPNANSDCQPFYDCEAYVYWNGSPTNHGNGSTFTVDNPGGSGFQYYTKAVFESNANGYYIGLGVDHNYSCKSLSFVFTVVIHGNTLITDCTPVPNKDINQLALFQLSYYASNGGGIFYTVSGYTGSIWNHKAYACSGCTQAFNYVANDFVIAYNSFTGHAVWGGAWVDNQYFDGAWHYDTNSNPPILLYGGGASNGPPPQMFWFSPPNGSNNGGDLWSCLYDSTSNSCNLGS